MGWGGRLSEAGRLLTFSAFGMGAYSRSALIRGWALIRMNTVQSKYRLICGRFIAFNFDLSFLSVIRPPKKSVAKKIYS